jgi:fermentation-respiration switch protein FrsA (DUF1100 family)
MRQLLVVWIALRLLTAPAAAQIEFIDEAFAYDTAQPAAGHWMGDVQVGLFPNSPASLLMERDESGEWKASLTLIAAYALDVGCSDIEIDGSSVAFTAPLPGRPRFTGKVSNDGQRFRGSVALTAVPADQLAEQPAEHEFEMARMPRPMDLPTRTAYTGDLEIPQMGTMGMTFVFAQTPGGNWVGHLDVPIQGLLGFSLNKVHRDGQTITAEVPSAPFTALLEAEFREDERRLVGRFKQATFDLAVDFVRDDGYAGPKLNRPQHPKPPYPYLTEEVTITHPDGHALAGTLTKPKAGGPFPAVVLVSGSGPQDRDETIFGHKPFLVLADHLTRRGIAVLRYDDRGTARSTGQFSGATTEDLATDTMAAVDFLKTAEAIDTKRIGLIGHSEGAMIAPMVAAQSDDVAFIVLLAGPGVPGDELLLVQSELALKAGNADEVAITKVKLQQEHLFQLIRQGASADELRDAMRPIAEAELAITGLEGEALQDMVEIQLEQITSAWIRFFITYDPRPALAKVTCPVLALNGTLDLQVWHEQNLTEIERVLTQTGIDVTVKRYEGLNHLFQPAESGSVMEYVEIETTFDETVMRDIVTWIKQTLGG